jgi:hypothetical protein
MRHKILDTVGFALFAALLFAALFGLILRNPDWFWMSAGCTIGLLLGKGISALLRGWWKKRNSR